MNHNTYNRFNRRPASHCAAHLYGEKNVIQNAAKVVAISPRQNEIKCIMLLLYYSFWILSSSFPHYSLFVSSFPVFKHVYHCATLASTARLPSSNKQDLELCVYEHIIQYVNCDKCRICAVADFPFILFHVGSPSTLPNHLT